MMHAWWIMLAAAACLEPMIIPATAAVLIVCLAGMWLGGKAGLK